MSKVSQSEFYDYVFAMWQAQAMTGAVVEGAVDVQRIFESARRAYYPMGVGAKVVGGAEAEAAERVCAPNLDAYRRRVSGLAEELAVTDALLAERQRVLDAIPECPVHGACVPHALEWIEEAKRAMALVDTLKKPLSEWGDSHV